MSELTSKECDEFSAEALASWLRAKYARHRELEDLKAAELIERFQQREREAFRLANAATYFVTAERSLHKELLAFMDGQISKPEDYSGFEPPVRHAVTCKLFPDPHDERDPVGPCTCGATSPPPDELLTAARDVVSIVRKTHDSEKWFTALAVLMRVVDERSTATKEV